MTSVTVVPQRRKNVDHIGSSVDSRDGQEWTIA